jgi:hypothetical protein
MDLPARASCQDIDALDIDARKALHEAKPFINDSELYGADRGGHVVEDEDEDEDEDEETEEDILTRAMEESAFEQRQADPERVDHAVLSDALADVEMGQGDDGRGGGIAFTFPVLPTHIPDSLEEEDEGMDTATKAMMDQLLKLSGPDTIPSVKLPVAPKVEPGKGGSWNIPGLDDDRDADIDSWCCKCSFSLH